MRAVRLASIRTSVALAATTALLAPLHAHGGERTYEPLERFARVLAYVENNHVDRVDEEALLRGAIRGMLETLDEHSAFLTPEELAQLEAEGEGEPVEGVLHRGIAHVRIASFQERTSRLLGATIERLGSLHGRPLRGLVLDLRGNPGGLVDEAVAVTDRFLQEGQAIVRTRGHHGRHAALERATGAFTVPGYPMVVLVDSGTASSAEIVAAALQDHGRALIVGARTYGKGSVQTLLRLDDGSGLKLTVARYYTPLGRSLQGRGVVPDLLLEEASVPVSTTVSASWAGVRWPGEPLGDPALEAGLAYLDAHANRAERRVGGASLPLP